MATSDSSIAVDLLSPAVTTRGFETTADIEKKEHLHEHNNVDSSILLTVWKSIIMKVYRIA